MSAKTLTEFREMVLKRRLTHADEIYHQWVEQLFEERDQWRATSHRNEQHLIAAEKERDDFKAKLNQRYLDAATTTAWQRRDMTLTAKQTPHTIVDHDLWEVYAEGRILIAGLTKGQAENLIYNLDRWSREGKVEPEAQVTTPFFSPPAHDPYEGATQYNGTTTVKPPAPDLAALRTRLLTALTDDAVHTLEAFIDAKLAAREEK